MLALDLRMICSLRPKSRYRESWRSRLSRILSRNSVRNKRSLDQQPLILKRPSVLEQSLVRVTAQTSPLSSVSGWYEVPGEDSPLTTFTQAPDTEENNELTLVTAPPVNATNSFYENDISLDPLDVILQLQMQVGSISILN